MQPENCDRNDDAFSFNGQSILEDYDPRVDHPSDDSNDVDVTSDTDSSTGADPSDPSDSSDEDDLHSSSPQICIPQKYSSLYESP